MYSYFQYPHELQSESESINSVENYIDSDELEEVIRCPGGGDLIRCPGGVYEAIQIPCAMEIHV